MSSVQAKLPSARVLTAAGFGLAFVVVGGGLDTVGIFLDAIARGLGWPHASLSLAVAVGAVTAALATPLLGVAIDRVGVRLPVLGGVAGLGAGYAILVAMREPWHFVAANLFLGVGFAAASLFPITVAITALVRERPAFALGVAATGSSAGALLLAPAVQALVEAVGWRSAYAVVGAAVVLAPLPVALFVLPRGRLPVEARPAPSGGPALRRPGLLRELLRPAVLPLVAVMVLPHLATFAISVHLVPLLTASGLSGAAAAFALGLTIGLSGVGKIGGGLLADRAGGVRVLRAALLGMAVALLFLHRPAAPGPRLGFVALYGLGLGAYLAVLPPLARSVLGAERFGTLFGALQLGAMLASAAGPVLAGALFDATGGYAAALLLWELAALGGLGAALRLRLPAPASAADVAIASRELAAAEELAP